MRARTNILRSRRIEGPLKSGYFHSSSVNPSERRIDVKERERVNMNAAEILESPEKVYFGGCAHGGGRQFLFYAR